MRKKEIKEMKVVNVGAALRVLGHCVKDLNRLSNVNRELLIESHLPIYDVLSKLRGLGYTGFSSIDSLGIHVDVSEVKEIEYSVEVLKRIIPYIDEVNFRSDLELSGVGIENMYVPLKASLRRKRELLNDSLKNEFEIDGFPLPIVRGKMNTIVAPSHSGKTIYAIALAVNLARKGHKVLFVSTEEGEESFIEKTLKLDVSEEMWDRLHFVEKSDFNKENLYGMLENVANSGFEFVVLDYMKKSMWDNYTSDHVVMEEINSTILRALAAAKSLSVFAFIQSNRGAYADKWDLKKLMDSPDGVAELIDGGMPAYRSADNVLFIKKENGLRNLVVCKARRNHNMMGSAIQYNVNLSTYDIHIEQPKKFIESSNIQTGDKKIFF